MDKSKQLTELVKSLASKLGFDACGIAPAEPLCDDNEHLLEWLDKGYHANMHYMQKHAAKRHDPGALVANAKSVIVLLYNYFPETTIGQNTGYRISAYAYGKDYHDVIRKKLNSIIKSISEICPGSASRGFVDSAPVLERAWATRAGLGWIGKNSMLITKHKGSYFFIAEIITDFLMEYDQPMGGNYCGDCSRCMDSCPTGAIVADRIVDANRCISYHTIENKGDILQELKGKFDNWIFGCDVCQQVCPWNRFCIPHQEPAFLPDEQLVEITDFRLENLNEEEFGQLFRNSAVKRTKFAGLMRNISFAKAQ